MGLEKEYTETLQSLFSRRTKIRQKDTGELSTALAKFQNPHLSYPAVHVAGTNGKGQVAVKVARALEFSGYRVGLFTSPHLFQYEERIAINQEKIPRSLVVQHDKEIMEVMKAENLKLNFFECTFISAVRYFADNCIDVGVFEAGIGGRYDSTNLLYPLVSVITSISKDHTEVLGDSLDEIAHQKAGIIKPKTPVVIGPRAKFLPVLREAEAQDAPVHIVERQACFYDTENLACAREALAVLSKHFHIGKTDLEAGLRETLPCRFEKKGNVIYDVAHNPDGMSRLSDALAHLYPNRRFRFVFGMGSEKDIRGSLEKLENRASYFHLVQAKDPDSADPEAIAAELKKISACPYSIEPSIKEGVARAKAATPKGEILVVCGSFYIMHEAYQNS